MAAISDPIADFLTRIRNATQAQHRYVDVDWSVMKQNIADILKAHGFIDSFLIKHESKQRGTMRLFLKKPGHIKIMERAMTLSFKKNI